MDSQHAADRVAEAFSKDVIVTGAKRLEEDARIFGAPEVRFTFELDALNSILVDKGKLCEGDGKPVLVDAREFAGAKVVALGKHLATSPMSLDVLAEAVKVLGQLSKVSHLEGQQAVAQQLEEGIRSALGKTDAGTNIVTAEEAARDGGWKLGDDAETTALAARLAPAAAGGDAAPSLSLPRFGRRPQVPSRPADQHSGTDEISAATG